MSKPFNISPNQVKIVIIVSRELEDKFMSFLFNLGYSYVERDLTLLAIKLELYGIILIREDDTRVARLFKALYDVCDVTYYVIGAKHLLTSDTVDPFIHNIFVNKDQWKEFNSACKNLYGKSFEQFLEEIR